MYGTDILHRKARMGLSDKTATGKKRNFEKMTFGSVLLRLMPKEKKQRKK
jgi:hypothetical protein